MLNQWRKLSADNENTYKETEKLWLTVGKAKAEFDPNVDLAWTKFSQKLHTKKSAWPTIFKMAAALLICVALGFFVKQYLGKDTNQKTRAHHKKNDSNTEVAANDIVVETTDSVQEVFLPDSSIVMVNANSSLKYVSVFEGEERLVHLEGEAFFEIIPEEKPFIVSTEHLTVKVIGTSFNVRSFEKDETDEVTVEEGRVEVTSKKNTSTNVVLSKGEKCIYDIKNDSFKTEKVKTKHKWWNKISNRWKRFLERIKRKKAAKQAE